MNDKVIDTIARALYEAHVSDTLSFKGEAERILAALKAAHVAVVELPPEWIIPTGWGDDCLGAWKVSDSEDPMSAWPLQQVALPNGDFVTPTYARKYAAALLAAADAAEAVAE